LIQSVPFSASQAATNHEKSMSIQATRTSQSTVDAENCELAPADEPQTLSIDQHAGETEGAAVARARLNPSTQAALTVVAARWGDVLTPLRDAQVSAVVAELKQQATAVSANNLARLEEMLTAQAHSLDAVWNECARRARLNITANIDAFDRYIRIGLKAQSQCRSAIEALAEIKNPKPFVAVGQANVSNGPQQVNNGVSASVRPPAHAGENTNSPNELLEHCDGERLDRRASSLSSGADPEMVPMAQVDGTEK
jgi:hypothetical protein